MRYLSGDVAHFVSSSPCLALAKPSSAVALLKRNVEAAEECSSALRAYPDLLIEPLEFFYTCLRSLGALDQAFFEALLRDNTWRGAVWGAWLAMLDPRGSFLPALRDAAPRWPHNEWILACAIATIEQRAPAPQDEAIVALAARCRRSLDRVPRPVVPLRQAPTEAEILQMDRERERVRSLYVTRGVDAARAALPGTLVEFYARDYVRWVRSLASAPTGPTR